MRASSSRCLAVSCATFSPGPVSVVKEEDAGKISSWQEGTDLPRKEKLRILISMFLREFVLDGGFDKSVMDEQVYRIFFENFNYGFDGPGCKFVRGEVFEARVWAFFVIANPLCLDDPAGLGQRAEQRLV